jgi:hypothetical protein
MNPHNLETQFVVCINNQDYQASLEVRKIYQIIPDNRAAEHQFIRVIDESGEDYLYPVAYFVPIAIAESRRSSICTDKGSVGAGSPTSMSLNNNLNKPAPAQ